jgi:ABC-type spermidine/putrescine transport system permease subunit II
MSNGKNLIKAFLLSVVIVVGFLILFQILRFQEEQMGIVVATIIVFSMILCTYAIIDEIRKSKDTKE